MPAAEPVLYAAPPDLVDARGAARLLVWGGLAQWMVVDEDLHAFLRRFEGGARAAVALRRHARATRRSPAAVAAEAGPVLADLQARGILRESPGVPPLAEEPLLLSNLTVNLTNACNLRCTFCYNRTRGAELPVEVLISGLRAGRRALAADASLIVLGGEPTLRPERLLALVDGVGDLFARPPMVSTNGTLVTPDLARALAARGVEVQVSVDGVAPVAHDAARGPGTHARALAGARSLVDAGVHTILSMVYTRDNLAQLEPYLDLARDLGVQEARFIPLRCIGGGAEHVSLRPDQHAAFRHLAAILERRPELRPLLVRDWFTITLAILGVSARRVSCGIGRRVLFVDADGSLYPCPNHVSPMYHLGHLGETPLAEVLDTEALAALRARYRVDAYTRCRACPFRAWCAGDCRGEVMALTGDPHAPSPHCAELRGLYREALWMLGAGTSPFASGRAGATRD